MLRQSFLVLVLSCVTHVYGQNNVESRLLELEYIVKTQGVAIEQQGVTLEHQRELLDLQREELNTYKTVNENLKNQVRHLEDQLRLVIDSRNDALDLNETPTETEFQQPTNGTLGREEMGVSSKQDDTSGAGHKHLNKRSIVRRSASDVAFFAYLTGTLCLHEHETLVFDTEITNMGNGYNPSDGIFTVPTSGPYVFTWTTSSRQDHYISAITVNDNAISHAFADTEHVNSASHATGIVVINVNQGDRVSIKKVVGNGCNIHDPAYHLTTFAGWRLFG